MFHWNRRQFLARSGAGSGAALAAPDASSESETAIDFRYAPFSGQTAFCFPDDSAKSLVGDRGELRYGYANGRFETVVAFSFSGVEPDVVARQELESPAVPSCTPASTVPRRSPLGRTVRAAHVVVVESRRPVKSKGNAVYLDNDRGGAFRAA